MPPSHRPASGQQQRIRRHARNADVSTRFDLLTAPRLLDRLEALPGRRDRVFPPAKTLSMFVAQALSAEGSCREVLDEARVGGVLEGLKPGGTDTGGYCKGRARLPLARISTSARQSGGILTEGAALWWQWRGRPVRLVDGTTVTLPDTEANQAAYPPLRSQKAGRGLPICRGGGVAVSG